MDVVTTSSRTKGGVTLCTWYSTISAHNMLEFENANANAHAQPHAVGIIVIRATLLLLLLLEACMITRRDFYGVRERNTYLYMVFLR